MVMASLPLVLLDPDQAPDAVQPVALDEDQVIVTVVLSKTEVAEAEILIVGDGVVPSPLHAVKRREQIKMSARHLWFNNLERR